MACTLLRVCYATHLYRFPVYVCLCVDVGLRCLFFVCSIQFQHYAWSHSLHFRHITIARTKRKQNIAKETETNRITTNISRRKWCIYRPLAIFPFAFAIGFHFCLSHLIQVHRHLTISLWKSGKKFKLAKWWFCMKNSRMIECKSVE